MALQRVAVGVGLGGDKMKFPILGFGQTTQQETSQNREGLTTEEAVALAEQRIALLETELARGGLDGQTRAGLLSELRSYKTFKATMVKAISEGQVRPNQKMFNNKGRPNAQPGTWVAEAMKSFRVAEGMGPEGRSLPRGYTPAMMKFYKERGTEIIKGVAGEKYPGMPGFVFAEDGTTPLRMIEGNPYPGMFADAKGNYFVFGEKKNGFEATQIIPGNPVIGRPGLFYDKGPKGAPVDDKGNILTYKPNTTASAVQVVVGQPGSVHAIDGSIVKAQTGSNINFIGPGNTHVFPVSNFIANNSKTMITPVQKRAGVLVPGQSDRVFAENVQASYVQVRPGVMVPGSGNHATAGGAARRLMYRSSNPAQTVAWTAGGDATFNSKGAADTNPATRFDASGQITTFSAGNAHPTKTRTVFNTDFSNYAVRVGAEVPGSEGYDIAEGAKTPDGLGPAARVYDSQLNPVLKERGSAIPGQSVDKVYGNATTAITIAPGQAVITPKGTSPSEVYGRGLQPVRKERGLIVPTRKGQPASQIFTAEDAQMDLVTLSREGKETPVVHTITSLPMADAPVIRVGMREFSPYVFDPTLGPDPRIQIPSLVERGQNPTVLMLPGNAKQLSLLPTINLQEVMVAPLPEEGFNRPITSDMFGKESFIPFEEGIEAGLVAEEVGRGMRALSIQDLNPLFATANIALSTGKGIPGKGPDKGIPNKGKNSPPMNKGNGLGSVSPMNRQGGYLGASVSTTSSSRASGAYRMADTRAEHRWI